MLPPDYLEHAPDEVLRLVEQAQEDILADMARRIAKVGSFTETAAWQEWRLEQLALTREEIIARLAKLTGKTKAELRRLFKEAASFGLKEDDAIYTAAGLSPAPANASPVLLQLLNAGLRQTLDTFQNLTRTTANTATGQFEQALDRAWVQVTSGAFDAPTAIRRAVKDLAQAGLSAIVYPTGHRDTLEVATRRAVLTGVGKTTGEIALARAEEMGCDLMEITAHPGARPEHAEWQGKIVSLSGRPGYLSLEDIGYGTGPGFKGWNCRHDWFPFYEGVSESAYPREKLAEYDRQTVEYNGQQLSYYDATQRQRGIERNVRRWKREYTMLEAAGQDTTEAAAKLAKWRAVEKDFCKQTGLPRDSARTQVHGFGRSQASRAVWENRKIQNTVEKNAKNDIIVPRTTSAGGNAVHHLTRLDIEKYKCVSDSIITDEVVLTDERIRHIKDRHPNDFERYQRYIAEVINAPDYILEANKPNTAFVLKRIIADNEHFQVILRLAVQGDPEGYKNSVITFLRVEEKRYNRYLRTKKILYKSE